MSQKTTISELHYSDSGSKTIGGLLPQNNVLYVDQFTNEAPTSPDELGLFQPATMNDVFRHYTPGIEDVDLTNDEGEHCYENFSFNRLDDFDDDQIINQSPTLQSLFFKRDACLSIENHFAHNRRLKELLTNLDARQALREVFIMMRNELRQK